MSAPRRGLSPFCCPGPGTWLAERARKRVVTLLAAIYAPRVNVSFYATLRQLVGTKTVEFDLPGGATARELLDAVGERFPAVKALIWNDDGSLGDYIKVFVDGREIRHLQMLDTPVPGGAQVDIFPPAAGG